MVRTKNEDDESALLIDQSQSVNGSWLQSTWIRWFSDIFFCSINPLFKCVNNGSLTIDDLNCLSHEDKCSTLYERISTFDLTQTSLMRILIKLYWKRLVLIGCLLFPLLFIRIARLMVRYEFILYFLDEQNSSVYGYLYAIGIFGSQLLNALILQQYNFHSSRFGLQIRNSLACIIYRRLLHMRLSFSREINIGYTMNLFSNDITKFENFFDSFHFLWAGLLDVLIIFGLLCWIIGFVPTVSGFCVLILLMFIQMLYSRKYNHYHQITMKHADKRIHAYQELIHGFEVIKIYNWEQSIMKHITNIRGQELNSIRRASLLRALNLSLFLVSITLVGLAIFVSSWCTGQPLTPIDYFIAIMFYGPMRLTMIYELPRFFEKYNEIQVAWKRIDQFLQIAIKQQQMILISDTYQNEKKGTIEIHDASFGWNLTSISLSSIDISIESGTFVGIIGPVGSGKSSLLAAILGEMIQVNGHIDVNGSSFSYTAQSPWIFSDTLRANILFGKPFDEQRYKDVLYACCLDIDLAQLGSSSDLTRIGERGINLSGGQKSRVSLARALYADADVYLLDDPLAAVDRTVAKQIYDRCIGPNSLLKDKTRLLVTHRREFLIDCHQTIVLARGQIQTEDSFHESQYDLIQNNTSMTSLMLEINQTISDTKSTMADKEEGYSTVSVSWSVWYSLFTAPPFGLFGLCLMIILLLLGEILYDGTNLWLSQQSLQPNTIYIYLGLTVSILSVLLVRGIFFFYHTLNGSNYLHHQMLTGLLHTSLAFYESNSSGRILNRASKDQQVIDKSLPETILESVQVLLTFAGAVVLACLLNYWNIFLVMIVLFILWMLHNYYMKLNYTLVRLESVTRSSVYGQLSASLDGLPTIRSFRAEHDWIQMLMNRIDINTKAYINMVAASKWFGLRIDFIISLYILFFVIFVIILHDKINPSLLVVGLTSMMNIISWCEWGMRRLSEAKAFMTSAERILEYAKLPRELDDMSQNHNQPADDWPNSGTIEFRNYSMRYGSRHETSLKNINFAITSGEKIGIIGRTGAGKSSLFRSLLRLIDGGTIEGQILVDNIDINHVILSRLRSCFSVIPQRPMLFTGTLRDNIDPLKIYSDEQCWMVLEAVQLKQWASEHEHSLLLSISEGGSNLSVGQCHLICIARALIKQCKFLLVDEATANVDRKTDQLLQSVISDQFSDRTVLTIAHRLNTIAKSDRILVMDEGKITDFDVPAKILHNSFLQIQT